MSLNMIIDFYDKGTEDVYNGIDSKESRKTLPVKLRKLALRKFYFLDNAVDIDDLKTPPGNKLELLVGDRQGQYSITRCSSFLILTFCSQLESKALALDEPAIRSEQRCRLQQ